VSATRRVDAALERVIVLAEGENARIEYKQELGKDQVNRSFSETVAAFGNGSGGTILVGVSDDAKVVGFDHIRAADMIVEILRARLKEALDVVPERIVLYDKPIWVVTVPPQLHEHKPFRCDGRVMIRVWGATREATTAEILSHITPECFTP